MRASLAMNLWETRGARTGTCTCCHHGFTNARRAAVPTSSLDPSLRRTHPRSGCCGHIGMDMPPQFGGWRCFSPEGCGKLAGGNTPGAGVTNQPAPAGVAERLEIPHLHAPLRGAGVFPRVAPRVLPPPAHFLQVSGLPARREVHGWARPTAPPLPVLSFAGAPCPRTRRACSIPQNQSSAARSRC